MRLSIILLAMSLSALVSASAAIAQSPSTDQKPTRQQNAEFENPKWYFENTPYRPCPVVATINGREVCLGCPSVCPWAPPNAKQPGTAR
jgi:hypothetical protein